MTSPRQDESSATGFKAVDKAAEAAEAAAHEAKETLTKETRTFADEASVETRETASAAVDAARAAAPDPEAMSRATEAVAARMRDLSSEWVQAFREQAARSLDGVARLATCRTPLDLVRLQGELARQNLDDSVTLARRLNSASLRAWSAIAQDSAKAAGSLKPPLR